MKPKEHPNMNTDEAQAPKTRSKRTRKSFRKRTKKPISKDLNKPVEETPFRTTEPAIVNGEEEIVEGEEVEKQPVHVPEPAIVKGEEGIVEKQGEMEKQPVLVPEPVPMLLPVTSPLEEETTLPTTHIPIVTEVEAPISIDNPKDLESPPHTEEVKNESQSTGSTPVPTPRVGTAPLATVQEEEALEKFVPPGGYPSSGSSYDEQETDKPELPDWSNKQGDFENAHFQMPSLVPRSSTKASIIEPDNSSSNKDDFEEPPGQSTPRAEPVEDVLRNVEEPAQSTVLKSTLARLETPLNDEPSTTTLEHRLSEHEVILPADLQIEDESIPDAPAEVPPPITKKMSMLEPSWTWPTKEKAQESIEKVQSEPSEAPSTVVIGTKHPEEDPPIWPLKDQSEKEMAGNSPLSETQEEISKEASMLPPVTVDSSTRESEPEKTMPRTETVEELTEPQETLAIKDVPETMPSEKSEAKDVTDEVIQKHTPAQVGRALPPEMLESAVAPPPGNHEKEESVDPATVNPEADGLANIASVEPEQPIVSPSQNEGPDELLAERSETLPVESAQKRDEVAETLSSLPEHAKKVVGQTQTGFLPLTEDMPEERIPTRISKNRLATEPYSPDLHNGTGETTPAEESRPINIETELPHEMIQGTKAQAALAGGNTEAPIEAPRGLTKEPTLQLEEAAAPKLDKQQPTQEEQPDQPKERNLVEPEVESTLGVKMGGTENLVDTRSNRPNDKILVSEAELSTDKEISNT